MPYHPGNIFRRLTSKCVMSGVADRAGNMLSPYQLGVGVPGGLEAVIHAVTQLVEEGDEDLMLLQLDLVNAFNIPHPGQASGHLAVAASTAPHQDDWPWPGLC